MAYVNKNENLFKPDEIDIICGSRKTSWVTNRTT